MNPWPPPDGFPMREQYVLKLYVTGTTPNSLRSIANLKAICEAYLEGRYQLEVHDLYQEPELIREHHLIAAPTLIKEQPLPYRKLIGDMSDTDRVLAGLGL